MWVPYKFGGSHVNFNQSKECVDKSYILIKLFIQTSHKSTFPQTQKFDKHNLCTIINSDCGFLLNHYQPQQEKADPSKKKKKR